MTSYRIHRIAKSTWHQIMVFFPLIAAAAIAGLAIRGERADPNPSEIFPKIEGLSLMIITVFVLLLMMLVMEFMAWSEEHEPNGFVSVFHFMLLLFAAAFWAFPEALLTATTMAATGMLFISLMHMITSDGD